MVDVWSMVAAQRRALAEALVDLGSTRVGSPVAVRGMEDTRRAGTSGLARRAGPATHVHPDHRRSSPSPPFTSGGDGADRSGRRRRLDARRPAGPPACSRRWPIRGPRSATSGCAGRSPGPRSGHHPCGGTSRRGRPGCGSGLRCRRWVASRSSTGRSRTVRRLRLTSTSGWSVPGSGGGELVAGDGDLLLVAAGRLSPDDVNPG